MRCPHCDFDNPPGTKFCGQCGAKLAAVCSQCGCENPPGFKFCGECGRPLAAPPPAAVPPPAARPAGGEPEPAARSAAVLHSYTPPFLAETVLQSRAALEGERKQVTVLFCDLVNSTALADRLGPEVMHLLLNGFFELALGEVHRYEGTINQFLGDGFMALFGAPVAHEDHARRAALAALGLQKALREPRSELGGQHAVELQIRIGLNTGWVVVGGIGDHLRMDYTAVGDTTNLAARLQQLAEPGSILASEATARLIQDAIRLEPLAAVRVKGKPEPVTPYRVAGILRGQSEPAVAGGAALSPFVGREREIAALDELRALAAGAEGQVVGVTGEAGAGKSRLLYELRRRPRDDGEVWLAGRCLSYGGGVPYLPLLHLLRGGWGIAEHDGPETVAAKLRHGLAAAGMDAEECLPYLLRLVGIEAGTERLAELSPQALRARTFRILRQLLVNAGQGRLVVLQLEDLHWIDETSEDFLDFLIEGLAPARVLLLLTYRAGYQPRWIGKSYATQIALRRLSDGECQLVMEAVLRRATLRAELASAVLSRAEGNPFFVEELTRSLMERQPLAELAVPETIHGVLMARIDRLPEEHKRLLQTASVLGREFTRDLLQAVWEHPDPSPLLADLKRWEFLYEEPTAEEQLYFFKHALTQEAVYQALLTSRRQALHAAAGRALEAARANHLEEAFDSLAYHYARADEPAKAALYLALFARRAASGYAHAEAAKALREALAQAASLPDGERQRRTAELVLQLSESLLPLARFPEELELLLQHRELFEQLLDLTLSGPYYFWLAHTYSYLGDQKAAASNARFAIAAARECGDAATEGRASYVLSRDAFWAGRFSEGIEHGLQAVALLEQGAERWWQGQAYWVAGFHHYVLGRFAEALRMMARAQDIWQALADPRLDPSWSTGYFYASWGDYDAGIEACQGGLARARDPLNTAAALGFLGYAYLEKGDLQQAIPALEDSVRRLEQAGMQQLLGWFEAFLAEAYLRDGRSMRARETALRALDVTTGVEFWFGVGFAQRALGRIAHAAGDHVEADRRFAAGLERFLFLQAPFEAARTQLDLALVARARGRDEEAARQLGEARRLFERLAIPKYVERAERLAGELASPLAPAD